MTTSSSDSRCTRISPSAVLDDRLDGKDLEWARDHLRRCEACRERVEDFREMLLRVGRLPKATVGANAMDQAYTAAIPERLRDDGGSRPYASIRPDEDRLVTPVSEPAELMYPEVTSVPDLMSELEREIYRDEPAQDHPTPLIAHAEARPIPALEPFEDRHIEEEAPEEKPVGQPAAIDEPVFDAWREVPIDSHREPQLEAAPAPPEPLPESTPASEPQRQSAAVLPEPAPEPEPEPMTWLPAPVAEREPEAMPEPTSEPAPIMPLVASAPGLWEDEPAAASPQHVHPSEHSNVVFDHESALTFAEPEPVTAPARKSDRAMRVAVGLGAAACVLLAAVLYEGGSVLKLGDLLSGTSPTVRATVHSSASASKTPRVAVSPSAPPTASAPPATVLFVLGDGVGGGSVFRIRPGTAVAGYTRLVFDIHGTGLPSMIVTRPDDSHVQVFFKNTTVADVPVSGIHSYHVAAVEPGVQQAADSSFLIDLAHPVRVTAFTLPATGSYAWRLVVDLHTS